MRVHIDFETRSTTDLRRCGVHKYVEDPYTDVLCAAWAVDDGPVGLWAPGQDDRALVAALEDAEHVVAHNAAFERAIVRGILTPRYGWPEIPLEKWRCTMAMAYAMGLPGSLDGAARALGLAYSKDMSGHRLMLAMCKPRRAHKNEDPNVVHWREDEKSKERLYAYCKPDVLVERELEKHLCPLSAAEQELWFLDQRINDRGVLVDRQLCESAKRVVAMAIEDLDGEMCEVTCGAVANAGNAAQLAAFLRSRGVGCTSVAKDEIENMLALDGLPGDCRRALVLRQQGALSSVAKFDAFLDSAGSDGRARGLLQYHATNTGRWAGRRIQTQNFRRPGSSEDDIDGIIKEVLAESPERIALFYGPVLPAVSDCLRGAIVAAPGNELVTADLRNIESRVLAWLAGDEFKLDLFRAFDAGAGEDIYRVAYANAFNIEPRDVTKAQRQIGKPIELALGYEGGPVAFQRMAKTYNVDIAASYDVLREKFPDEYEKSASAYADRGKTSGMPPRAWVAADIVKQNWRARNRLIVRLWAGLKEAAIAATGRAGEGVSFGRVGFYKDGKHLFMMLPAGRRICLPFAEVHDAKTPWGAPTSVLTFMNEDSLTRQWVRSGLYGGKLTNYATQGTARDILVHGMLAAEANGYVIRLTTHDDIMCEQGARDGSADELERLMCMEAPWAAGLPLAAGGFAAERLRK